MENKTEQEADLDMDTMEYSEFEEAASDLRHPGLIDNKRILTDREISRKNISPGMLAERMEEGYVIKLHRSFRDEIPLILLLVVVSVLVVWLTLEAAALDIGGFPAQFFLPLVIVTMILHRRFNSTYFIHKNGVAVVKGILKLYMIRFPLEYDKMRAVEVGKNLLQRLLNVGDIRISTQLIDQPEVVMYGIANPYFYGTLLRTSLSKFDPRGVKVEEISERDD